MTVRVRICFGSIWIFCWGLLPAQPLSVSTSQLDFGQTFTGESDSLDFNLQNVTVDTIRVQDIRLYSIYDSLVYRTNVSNFVLAPGASTDVRVYFSPEHNIQHASQMVLINDSHRGSVSVSLSGQGKFPNAYYDATENLSEEALKSALKTRITQGYQQQSYNAARDAMFMTIDNQKTNGRGASINTLEGVYTGFTVTNYTNRTDAQLQGFNTEHTFPQGFFNQNLPMRSDIHHLFPTKQTANSERANLPFGNVNNPVWQDGGSKHNNSVFEPRDVHKGAVARCMMYFVLRYQDYQNFLSGQEAVLRQWHAQFPPSAFEHKRNDDIFAVQNNRSPFVDYPQLLDRISTISGNSVAPAHPSIDLPETEIDYDTVFGNEDVDYYYVIVNDGNEALNLINFSFDDPQLSFASNSGDDQSLQPGEAHTVVVRLNMAPNSSLSANLSFDSASGGTVMVPVTAVSEGPNAIGKASSASLRIFPNPVSGTLGIQWERVSGLPDSVTLQVYDLAGNRVYSSLSSTQTDTWLIDTETWTPGLYLLHAEAQGMRIARKLIVE